MRELQFDMAQMQRVMTNTAARSFVRMSSTRPALAVVKAYAWLLAILLPVDWFAPTGELLREFGAKPASLVLLLGGLYGLLTIRPTSSTYRRRETYTALLFAAIGLLGTVGFLLNITMEWSDWRFNRNPLTQYVLQSALIVVSALAIIGNGRLALRYPIAKSFLNALPAAALMHLLIWSLEASDIISDSAGLLLLFRTDGGAIERATGLMSEPSYYGTMAALYGATMLVHRYVGSRRIVAIGVAIGLFASALIIVAKTIVVVAGLQLAVVVFTRSGNELGRSLRWVVLSGALLSHGFSCKALQY